MTLAFNTRQAMVMFHTLTHTHKLKFKVQSVQKIEWKQMDGQTDGRTQPIALASRPTWLVKNDMDHSSTTYLTPSFSSGTSGGTGRPRFNHLENCH